MQIIPLTTLRELQRQERAIEACNPRGLYLANPAYYPHAERIYLKMRGRFWLANSRELTIGECMHGNETRN